MKKRLFTITTIVFSLLFTSCLADYLNEKFGFTAPIYINYSSPYGNPPKRKQVTAGTELTEEDLPKLYIKADEYENEFQGWFLDNKYTNPAYPGFIIEKSITLYAQWKYDYKAATDTQGLYKVEFSFFDPDSGATNFEYNSEYDMYFNNSEFAMNYTRPFEGYEYIPGADHTYTYDDYSNDTYRPVTVYVKRYYKTHISANSFYSIGYYLPDYEGFTYNIYITDYAPAFALNVSPPSTNLHLEECLGLTEIPANTFNQCHWLKGIYLPSSITSIVNSAFADCTGLQTIIMPVSLTRLGTYAFSNCTALESIKIPVIDSYGNNDLSEGTFSGCSNLKTVYLPIVNHWSIGKNAFYDCVSLETVYFGGSSKDNVSIISEGNEKFDAANWICNASW